MALNILDIHILTQNRIFYLQRPDHLSISNHVCVLFKIKNLFYLLLVLCILYIQLLVQIQASLFNQRNYFFFYNIRPNVTVLFEQQKKEITKLQRNY